MLRNTFEDHVTYSQNLLFLFHLYLALCHYFSVSTVCFSRCYLRGVLGYFSTRKRSVIRVWYATAVFHNIRSFKFRYWFSGYISCLKVFFSFVAFVDLSHWTMHVSVEFPSIPTLWCLFKFRSKNTSQEKNSFPIIWTTFPPGTASAKIPETKKLLRINLYLCAIILEISGKTAFLSTVPVEIVWNWFHRNSHKNITAGSPAIARKPSLFWSVKFKIIEYSPLLTIPS